MLRKGDKPLDQAINRLAEMDLLNPKKIKSHKQMLSQERKEEKGVYEQLYYNNMRFDTTEKNKWFLTENNEIVEFKNATFLEGNVVVNGSKIKRKRDFYETPLKSSFLNIYVSNGLKDSPQIYSIASIKTKMFSTSSGDGDLVFFPILHNA